MRALARVFERSVPAYEHWMIDRLEIDAGMLSLENFDRDWVETVTRAIEKLLRERPPPAGSISLSSPIQHRTEAQSVQEAFLHFLRTGSLPWWFHLPAGTTLEEVILACWQTARETGGPQEDFGRILDAIGFAYMRNRLVRQFSADFLETLLTGFSREGAIAVNEVFAKLRISDFASGALRRFSEQL
ncbi:MAG: contractile injection system tape measure protein [Pseudomonadota bacterium]|nr:contractile injection system tape measure protein [Pseudomonadota bacterium]